jgi:hypothetical protein
MRAQAGRLEALREAELFRGGSGYVREAWKKRKPKSKKATGLTVAF